VRILLDTHAFLWWIGADDRLSARAAELVEDGGNEVFLSAASTWEIVVKTVLGRVEITDPLERFIPEQLERNAMRPLPIGIQHTLAVATLPPVHRDPFDRMLVAQATVEHMTLVSGDRMLRRYPVTVEW
jgi:PIN domain nuclease of toxin-antitoxin system